MASIEGAQRRQRFGFVILPAVLSQARLAGCHAELGAFAEARAELSAAVELSRTMEMTFWLPQAEVTLPRLG